MPFNGERSLQGWRYTTRGPRRSAASARGELQPGDPDRRRLAAFAARVSPEAPFARRGSTFPQKKLM